MKKFVAHKNSWWIFIKLVEVIVSFRMAQWPNGPISWDKSSWIVYIGKFYFLRNWLVLHSQKLINITYQKINCVIILWANWQFWRPTFFIGEIFFFAQKRVLDKYFWLTWFTIYFYPRAMAPSGSYNLISPSSENTSHNLHPECSQTKIFTWNSSQIQIYTYQKCKLIADLKKVLRVNKFPYPLMIPSSRSWKVKSKKIWIIDPPPHSSRSRV